MARIDLTPKAYLSARATRKAQVLWCTAVGLCALTAALPIVLVSSRQPDPAEAVAGERLVQAQHRTAQSKQQQAALRQALAIQHRALQAEQHLKRRPDWSALLQVVARQFDGQLLMTGIRLSGSDDPLIRKELAVLGQAIPPDSGWLLVQGMAENNRDVPALVLRIEQLGLFEQVIFSGTQRASHAGGNRTAFTLVCRLD